MKKLAHRIAHAAFYFAVFLFAVVDILLLWVVTGPRSLNELTPRIEAALSSADGGYGVRVGQTWLVWDGWRHPIDVRLRDVAVATGEGKTLATFPEISVDLDWLSLAMGQILPTGITVRQPSLSLIQNADRSLSFGFGQWPPPEGEEAKTVPLNDALAAFSPESSSTLRKLRRIRIVDAQVTVGTAHRSTFFAMTGAHIRAKRSRDGSIRILAGGMLNYRRYQSAIEADVLFHNDTARTEAGIAFEKIVPGALASLFADNPMLNVYNAPISGKALLTFGKEGALEQARFAVDGEAGYIDSPHLANSLPLSAMHAEGLISNQGKDIQIDALTLAMDKAVLSAAGVVSLGEDGDAAVRAKVSLKNARTDDVGLYWPPKLAPVTRQWVTENVTGGAIPEASASLNVQFGDLAKPELPKEAVDASIQLDGAAIRYLPDHPPAKNLRALIRIDGKALGADIESADYMQSTRVTGGMVKIDDLYPDNPYITVNLDATTTAKDAIHFLSLPRLGHAKALNLESETASGTADVHAEVGFHFFATSDDDIAYDVRAEMKDMAIPGLLHKFDVKNAAGTLTVDQKALTFKGAGNVNGAQAQAAEVTYRFTPQDGYDTDINVTASAPVSVLPRFGYSKFDGLTGAIGVKASLRLGPDKESAEATLDLTPAGIHAAAIGWDKSENEAATLEIKTEKSGGVQHISDFTLTGKDIDAAGSATLAKDLSGLQALSLKKARLGGTDLNRLEYTHENGALKLEAAGKSLDLSGWLDGEESSEFSFEQFPALTFKADIDRLSLSKDGSISAFKGEMVCDTRCRSANVSGLTGNARDFSFRILKNPKGKRQVSLHAADAGSFLKAFGALPNIDGGELTLTGTYDDAPAGSVLKGRLLVTDFGVRKAPVLAKILSLASLTGVLDLMQGSGIRFTKLAAPFTLQRDVVTLDEAKMYGGSIGISAGGTMTFPKRTLNLKGTVVPAYVVNNILGKVPIVGQILTGGGEGVFAFNYTVKGTEKDADVSVNPLSILTPGFLRGLFEAGDAPEKPAKR